MKSINDATLKVIAVVTNNINSDKIKLAFSRFTKGV